MVVELGMERKAGSQGPKSSVQEKTTQRKGRRSYSPWDHLQRNRDFFITG